jgi:hypothetical protein
MLSTLALITVSVAGAYLLALAAVSVLAPARATIFLRSFASSARVHYLELMLRLAVGGALLVYAPRMLFADAFALFGWVLIITTVGLFALPWRWHQRFARRALRDVTDYLKLIAAVSLTLGMLILVAVFWRTNG